MRTTTRQVAVLFAQILAAASAACGGSASSPGATPGTDAGPAGDSGVAPVPAIDAGGVDSGDDSGPVVGCGGCGCGGREQLDRHGRRRARRRRVRGPRHDGRPSARRSARAPRTGPRASARSSMQRPPRRCRARRSASAAGPRGLRCHTARGPSAIGRYFADVAQLEAASVPAFRRVARELSGFGAPRRLVRAAERAARDEIGHARAARALARRHGAIDAPFEASPQALRSLEDFAIENAVEGCVREAYGALVATWQAREAADPRVRAHFERIARDETSHAALALRIDAWARARLDPRARERVKAARGAARAELRGAIERTALDPATATLAGLPETRVALTLASELEERLGWRRPPRARGDRPPTGVRGLFS